MPSPVGRRRSIEELSIRAFFERNQDLQQQRKG
jgi:hypothetical protein